MHMDQTDDRQPGQPSVRLHPRRRMLGMVVAGLLAPTLGACSSTPLGGFMLSRQRLDGLLALAFPYQRSLAGLAELSLESPRLSLLPESNRLGTAVDVVVREGLTGSRLQGAMDLDYALRYDAGQGAIRMTDVRVHTLDFKSLPPAERALVSQYAPRVAEELLSGWVLYELPAGQRMLARELGVRALRVLPDGLHFDLGAGS